MHWKSLTYSQIKERVIEALHNNINYRTGKVLGIPGTFLDQEEFYEDAPFLKNAPFLSVFIANPNHIGCHTFGESESIFHGTQEIERELIALCAEEIFKGEKGGFDGYVASGGTEANIESFWIYRNLFKKEYGADTNEIALVYSEDSHYSMPKGADLLNLDSIVLKVDEKTRLIDISLMKTQLKKAVSEGKRYFILIMNMSTTMFGSVDDIDGATAVLDEMEVLYKVHVDAAFGGFVYPFSNLDNRLDFKNEKVSSIAIDGHKMLQAPYGTGIFIVRKGLMKYVETDQASYVEGKDFTICGSRSGANAVAVWMILMHHGSEGWKAKMNQLLQKTSRLCSNLDDLGIPYFRNPFLNITAIKADYVPVDVAKKYHLVADSFSNPKWWKIVVMAHVKQGLLDEFINELPKS
jgi:tyrosine decarboxylase / aspartate 1-decarboxylase